MIIINLPIYLFVLLITSLLGGGIIIGVGVTSWLVKKELQKLSKKSGPSRFH